MPTDALATLGHRASAVIVFITRANYSAPASGVLIVELMLTYCQLDVGVKEDIQNAPCIIKTGFIKIINLEMFYAKWEPLNLYPNFFMDCF